MDGGDLGGIHAVFVDDGVARQVADGYDMVGVAHSVELDAEHRRVGLAARTVELGGVDMDDHRFACYLLGMDSGRIGQPVVAVDDVEIERAGYDACADRIVVDLFDKIVGIAARELETSQVVGAHIVEVGVDMVAQPVVEVGRHDAPDALLDIVAVDVAPGYRSLACADYVGKVAVFVAEGLGDDEGYIHVATLPHAASEAVAGGAETAQNMRWELPPEH